MGEIIDYLETIIVADMDYIDYVNSQKELKRDLVVAEPKEQKKVQLHGHTFHYIHFV